MNPVKTRKLVFPVWIAAGLAVLLAGCATAPPANIDDICSIFEERPRWYREAKESYERWRVPIPTMMAIIYQESAFRSRARPRRRMILGFIPGRRPSTAFGYAQALDGTWDHYIRDTGNQSASRTRFRDAIDFVGWYCDQSHRRCGISKHDPYRLYLAYHEGHGGYNRGTYRNKGWLLATARRVRERSRTFERQLRGCREKLEKPRRRFLGIF